MRGLFALVFCFWGITSPAQTLSISIATEKYQIDDTNLLILSQLQELADYSNLTDYDAIDVLFGNRTFHFTDVPELLEYSSSYPVEDENGQYTLYFTQLPIIAINADSTIVDEPKVLANFTYTDEVQNFSSFIGIEIRGGFSQSYPKKTFDLEIWENESGDDTDDAKFGNLRKDDDWILDALYNEPLRIRSYLSHKLWLQIHQPHYLEEEPQAKSGADVEFVEVFLNNEYQGVYLLSEQVDRKQLKIKSFDGSLRGELYKSVTWGASTFGNVPGYNNNSASWGGYELKYPKADELIDWQYLHGFTDFVINASDEDFDLQIWDRFNKDNCMDYYLYLNLLRASDNTGKNIYVGKYDTNYPYFNVPWDLDGTWGTTWEGINDPYTGNVLSNGLFDRIIDLNPDGFNAEMGSRWLDYRSGVFNNSTLENDIMDAYNYLLDNNVYARESIVYPNYAFDEAAKNYTTTWLHDRLLFLDAYFYQISDSNDDKLVRTSDLVLSPNPATDQIHIASTSRNLANEPFLLLNSAGALVKQGKINADGYINVSGLPAGLYLLKVDHYVQKIVLR